MAEKEKTKWRYLKLAIIPALSIGFYLDESHPQTYIATLESKETVDGPKRRVYYNSTWRLKDGTKVDMENQEGWFNGLFLKKAAPSKLQASLQPKHQYKIQTVGNLLKNFGAKPNIVKVTEVK